MLVVYLFSVQTGYAIVNSGVQKDVGLSVTQVATIAATYTWVFALFQFYGGALLDQLGSRSGDARRSFCVSRWAPKSSAPQASPRKIAHRSIRLRCPRRTQQLDQDTLGVVDVLISISVASMEHFVRLTAIFMPPTI